MTSQSCIPFLHQLNPAQEHKWLSKLQPALSGLEIKPFAQLSEEEKHKAQVALAANPDPNEIVQLTRLKWIQSLWAGVENLLSNPSLQSRNIAIVRMVDPQLSNTMAEAVLAWTLYLHRNMPTYLKQQSQQNWKPLPYRPAHQVHVGLLGLGELGLAAAENLLKLNYRVLGWSRSQKHHREIACYSGEAGLETVLSTSDIVICLLPLTDDTRYLLDHERFTLMPKGAGLINFSRGAIIKTDDLIHFLDQGHLSHAVLDVFEQEPLPATNPIWRHERISVLPHIAAPTHPESAAQIASQNILTYLNTGTIPEPIEPVRGY